jgi:hypothetical protein|tara:strand:+ start:2054 stop:2296 length:243 start_codon:yes stop_codon:yes gene_type:complete
MAYESELIRTVTYVGESPTDKEWESTLLVKRAKLDDDQYIIINSEDSEDTGTFIWSEAQAKELFRAIKTAGQKIGWFENE